MQIHNDFIKLFYDRERVELLGKNKINLLKLIGIIAMTFFTIGFARGGMDYLNKKMKSPYLNWLWVEVPGSNAGKGQDFKDALNKEELKQKFGFNEVRSFMNFYMDIYYKDNLSVNSAYGRYIELNDPLLAEIYKAAEKDKVPIQAFEDDDTGLIVTKDFLKAFGYELNDPVIFINVDYRNFDRKIPIPIRGVVENLPGGNQILSTPYFYFQKTQNYGLNNMGNPFHPLAHRDKVHHKKLIYYVNDKEQVNQIANQIESFLKEHTGFKQWGPDVYKMENDHLKRGKNVWIDFRDLEEDSIKLIDAVHEELMKQIWIKEAERKPDGTINMYRNYVFAFYPFKNIERADFLSINLTGLDYVRSLRDYIRKNHKLEIDITDILNKENYNLVAALTFILSLVLIGLSILSMWLFVSNLISSHLDKIKMNLGTFKAFGLDNNTLTGHLYQNDYHNCFTGNGHWYFDCFCSGTIGIGATYCTAYRR